MITRMPNSTRRKNEDEQSRLICCTLMHDTKIKNYISSRTSPQGFSPLYPSLPLPPPIEEPSIVFGIFGTPLDVVVMMGQMLDFFEPILFIELGGSVVRYHMQMHVLYIWVFLCLLYKQLEEPFADPLAPELVDDTNSHYVYGDAVPV